MKNLKEVVNESLVSPQNFVSEFMLKKASEILFYSLDDKKYDKDFVHISINTALNTLKLQNYFWEGAELEDYDFGENQSRLNRTVDIAIKKYRMGQFLIGSKNKNESPTCWLIIIFGERPIW